MNINISIDLAYLAHSQHTHTLNGAGTVVGVAGDDGTVAATGGTGGGAAGVAGVDTLTDAAAGLR